MTSVQIIETVEGVRYVIDKNRILGQGAFGKVFSCKREDKPKQLAAKIVLIRQQKEFDNIMKEIMVHQIASEENDYVVKLVDYVDRVKGRQPEAAEGDKVPFKRRELILILERCDCNLKEYLEKKNLGRVREKEAQFLFIQIVEGLRGFGRNEIIHRDLKLENIMMRGYQVKFVDFGLSKLGTLGSSSLGTPFNMMPSVLAKEGVQYSDEVDVYAVGLILFEMVTGFHLYDREFKGTTKKEVVKELAKIKRLESGASLFVNKAFFRSQNFDPETISKELRDMLKFMITHEHEVKEQGETVYRLMELEWMTAAYNKFEKVYRPKLCRNGDKQRELITSQFRTSMLFSRVSSSFKSKKSNLKKSKLEKMETMRTQLMKGSTELVNFLSICSEEIQNIVIYLDEKKSMLVNHCLTKRQHTLTVNLLYKVTILCLGKLTQHYKNYKAEAFTSSGFEEHLVDMLGNKVFSSRMIKGFFDRILETPEFGEQLRFIDDDLRRVFKEFERVTSFQAARDPIFYRDVIKNIERNNWSGFNRAYKEFQPLVLSELFQTMVNLEDALGLNLNHSREHLDADNKSHTAGMKLRKRVFKIIIKVQDFTYAEKHHDFEDLNLLHKKLNMVSGESLRVEIEENLGKEDITRGGVMQMLMKMLFIAFLLVLGIAFFVTKR